MNRLSVMNEINALIEENCNGCEKRREINRRVPRGHLAAVDSFCQRECTVGVQLRLCGNQLIAVSTQNREVKRDMGDARAKSGPKEKAGPNPGLTKEVYLEQLAAGETQESIAKAWSVKGHTLKYWIEKWKLKGVNSDKARELLKPKGEIPLLRSTSIVAQAVEEKAMGIPAINAKRDAEQIEELTAKLMERDALVLDLKQRLSSFEIQLENWSAVDSENATRLAELTEDNSNWRQEALAYRKTAEEARQTIEELQEERQAMLVTIEQAASQEGKVIEPNSDPVHDAVNSPSHYTAGGIETIDFIRAKMSPEEFAGFCKGNVLKYVTRANLKGGNEDLKKAAVYLGWAVEVQA